MRRDHNGWRDSSPAQIVLHESTQRWTVKMIEMSVRYQHRIDRGKIGDAQAGATQSLQNEEPSREIWIDEDALSANLQEKTGVADEGDSEFSIGGQARLVSLAGAWRHCRAPHQTSELGGAFS